MAEQSIWNRLRQAPKVSSRRGCWGYGRLDYNFRRVAPATGIMGPRWTHPLHASRMLAVRDAHFLDHARVFGKLLTRHRAQFVGRAAAHRETQILELAANSRVHQRLQHLSVQPGDDVLWRAGRRQDRKPGVEEEPGQS